MQLFLNGFLVLLPLVFLPWANQQFELPKFVFLMACCGVMLLATGFSLFRRPLPKLLGNPVLLSGSLLLLYLLLHSMLISLVPVNSVWGSYQRHSGVLLYVLLFVVYAVVLRRREATDQILRWMSISGVLTAVLGIMQWLWPALWGGLAATSGRIFSTLGVPNFLGQWLLMTIVVTLYCSFRSRRRWLWLAGLLTQLGALILSGNRASLLVCGFLLLVLACVQLLRMPRSRAKAGAGVVLLLLFCGIGYGVVTRSDGPWRSLLSRAELYPMATQAVLERPQGYGLDSLYTAFSPRLPQNLGETENLLDVPDKVHQVVLDILAETGIVGLALFLWLWISIAMYGWRMLHHKNPEVRQRTGALLLALGAWFLSLLVSFPGVTERVYATVLVALLIGQGIEEYSPPARWQHMGRGLLHALTGLAILVVAIGTLVADVQYARLTEVTDSSVLTNLTRLTPMNLEYRIFGSNGIAPSVSTQTRIDTLQSALKDNPEDVWAWTFLADAQAQAGDYEKAKLSLASAKTSCSRCLFVSVEGAQLASHAGDENSIMRWTTDYFALLPSFVFMDPGALTPDVRERRRITLKEQKQDLLYMLRLSGNKTDPIIKELENM